MGDLFVELENESTRPVLAEIPTRFGTLSPDPLHGETLLQIYVRIRMLYLMQFLIYTF